MDTIRRLEWKDVFDTVRGYLFRYHKAGDDRVRPSAGSDNADIHAENSRAVVSTVYGNTVKFNQLVQNGDFSNGTTGWVVYGYSSIRTVTNNIITIIPSDGQNCDIHHSVNVVSGHKIFACYQFLNATTGPTYITINRDTHIQASTASGSWTNISVVYQATSDISYIGMRCYTNGTDGIKLRNYILIDLTAMGIDSFTTINQVEQWLALNVGAQDYYPYDNGSLISFGGTAIKSVGFNQWNEQWITYESTRIKSKTPIRVIKGATYYFKGNFSGYIYTPWYNIDGSHSHSGSIQANRTFVTEGDYMDFYTPTGTGGTYNNDICINLSDPTKNGTYLPYDGSPERTCDLSFVPNIGFQTFNIWDEICEVGGIDPSSGLNVDNSNVMRSVNYINCNPSTKYYLKGPTNMNFMGIRLYNSQKELIGNVYSDYASNAEFETPNNCCYIRLQTTQTYGNTYNYNICLNKSVAGLNGTYMPYGTPYYLFPDGKLKSAGSVSDEVSATTAIKRVGSVDLGTLDWRKTTSSAFPAGYFFLTSISNIRNTIDVECFICSKYTFTKVSYPSEDTMGIYGLNIRVYDSSYSDAATFKAAMSGVMLYYELATPITIPYNSPMTYKVDKYSTEELLVPSSQTGAPTSTALNADIDYQYRG